MESQGIQIFGMILFKKLFSMSPGLIHLFPFNGDGDMYKSEQFKDHSLRVVKSIG